MRGSISLPVNMVGYIVVLAIFLGIMSLIAAYWFEFQTLPRATESKKTTACDLAYMLSMWKNLTVYPNIFSKTFLEQWKGEEANKTANSIFENMSEFFLPGSDYFIHIYGEDSEPYSLYIPPESKSAFEKCALPVGGFDIIKIGVKLGVKSAILEFLNPLEYIRSQTGILTHIKKEDFEKIVTYDKIKADCKLITFIADGNNIKIGTMIAGLTTNIATKLREGFYSVGVKGKRRAYLDLGIYPQGCVVNKGGYKIEEKIKIKKEGGIFDIPVIGWIFGKIYDAFAYVTNVKTYVICGFNWNFNNTTNVLEVIPVSGEKECPLMTRIPKKIVNESNLSAKICQPKKVWNIVWWPYGIDIPGYKEGRKHFYLKIENIKPEGEWSKEKQLEYCKRECRENPVYLGFGKVCEDYCNKYYENPDRLNNKTYCYDDAHIQARGAGYVRSCKTARDYYLLYEKLPFNAIDVKYIIVDENKLAGGKSISELNKTDYREISTCATWPGIFECAKAEQCAGVPCVGHKCSSCNYDNVLESCSPDYLENAPSVGEGYVCQEVINQLWPSNNIMYECLPAIAVNRTHNGMEIDSVSCSGRGMHNAEITWIINASKICCEPDGWITVNKEIIKSDGTTEIKKIKKCERPSLNCPKMKFWPNINSSNVKILRPLGKEGYVINITQKVCRNGHPYNNANKVFIVAHYPVKNKIMEYSLMGSEIELNS